MPKSVVNPLGQKKKGSVWCSITGGTKHVDNMKFGPDGNDWVLYENLEEVTSLCGELDANKKFKGFRHVSKPGLDHICTLFSGWCFEVFSSSLPQGVIFLHIRPPKAMPDSMVDADKLYRFSTAELKACYKHAEARSHAPRVFRRNTSGWDEIAVNFCMKHGI